MATVVSAAVETSNGTDAPRQDLVSSPPDSAATATKVMPSVTLNGHKHKRSSSYSPRNYIPAAIASQPPSISPSGHLLASAGTLGRHQGHSHTRSHSHHSFAYVPTTPTFLNAPLNGEAPPDFSGIGIGNGNGDRLPGYLNPKHARHFSEAAPLPSLRRHSLAPPSTLAPRSPRHGPTHFDGNAGSTPLSPGLVPASPSFGAVSEIGEPVDDVIEVDSPQSGPVHLSEPLQPVPELHAPVSYDTPAADDGPMRSDSTPRPVYELASCGVLAVLPYIFCSLLDTTGNPAHAARVVAKAPAMLSSHLVAMTFMAAGGWSMLQQGTPRSFAEKRLDGIATLSAASLLATAISIALPFYATLMLGSSRTAIAVLLMLTTPATSTSLRSAARTPLAGMIMTMALFDAMGVTSQCTWTAWLQGYLSLAVSCFMVQPPFMNSSLPAGQGPSLYSHDATDSAAAQAAQRQRLVSRMSRLNTTDSTRVLLAGILMELALITWNWFAGNASPGATQMLLAAPIAASLLVATRVLPSQRIEETHSQAGLLSGLLFTALSSTALSAKRGSELLSQVTLACICYALQTSDVGTLRKRLTSATHIYNHDHHDHHHSHDHRHDAPISDFTGYLLAKSEGWPLLFSILKDKDSRKIFYFMMLNFGFMKVQMVYGIITGSLGLLSDSIHMLFDCLALAVGLCAAVMSKWPPSERFPYGYGKIDTLAGFANGAFLMIISIEIVYEAVDRLMSGSEVQHIGELLFVSTAGLLVNLVGIMSFDHAHHGHSHSGHDHGHDHSHGHGHGHEHGRNENMHGIFLHILADTLGSVAVVISTILVHYYKWSGFDPIASCMIAILIFASAVPLVASTSKSLLLELPADVEYAVRESLGEVGSLRGVVGYAKPRFWLDDRGSDDSHGDMHGHAHHDHTSHDHDCHHDDGMHSLGHHHHHDHQHHDCSPVRHSTGVAHTSPSLLAATRVPVLGAIHIFASRNADLDDVRRRVAGLLRSRNMDITVQVEREGDSRCWCGGSNACKLS